VIAEILPAAYDVNGRQVYRPSKRTHPFFRPTFPMGRFIAQPLLQPCATMAELRERLCTFRYVSDRALWRKADYWCPPDEFERLRKGDCEDFAFWTWRQLMAMGYPTRFVCGSRHAWVTFEKDGCHFLLEPLLAHLGEWLPRLSVIHYVPRVSLEWNGRNFQYFTHERRTFDPPLLEGAALASEWLTFKLRVWGGAAARLPDASRRLMERVLPLTD
jgi:hypothetical protein